LTGLLSHPQLTLVSPNLQGMSVVSVVMGIAHLLRAFQVSSSSPTNRVVVAMVVGSSLSSFGGAEPHLRGPALGLSCQCPPTMCMVLSIDLHRSCFSCSCSDLKRWYWDDRNRTSLAPIIYRPEAHPETSSYVPLVVSSSTNASDLAMVRLGSP
jgi:hypothetical protein